MSCSPFEPGPPITLQSFAATSDAATVIVTWVAESIVLIFAPAGTAAPTIDIPTSIAAVEESPVISGEACVSVPVCTICGPVAAGE